MTLVIDGKKQNVTNSEIIRVSYNVDIDEIQSNDKQMIFVCRKCHIEWKVQQ